MPDDPKKSKDEENRTYSVCVELKMYGIENVQIFNVSLLAIPKYNKLGTYKHINQITSISSDLGNFLYRSSFTDSEEHLCK